MSEVTISAHAIDRYLERVRPNLIWRQAKFELERLVAFGSLEPELPWKCDWHGDGFLVLSDGVALGLRMENGEWRAVTCLTRGGRSPAAVESRRERKRLKRRRRAAKRIHYRDHRPEAA